MKARPFTERSSLHMNIELPYPTVELDANGEVRRLPDGSPVFSDAPIRFPADEMHLVSVRKLFIYEHCNSRGLKAATQNIFWNMLTLCSYSQAEWYYDPVTGYPIAVDAQKIKALAHLKRPGNLTSTFEYAEMARRSGYSTRSINSALVELNSCGIGRIVKVPPSVATGITHKGGRPKDWVRFEFDSHYAWIGPFQHGLSHRSLNLPTYDAKRQRDQRPASRPVSVTDNE